MKNDEGQEDDEVPPREHILEAAEELCYREWLRGVGVEEIAAKARTTKMAQLRDRAARQGASFVVKRYVLLLPRGFGAVGSFDTGPGPREPER